MQAQILSYEQNIDAEVFEILPFIGLTVI